MPGSSDSSPADPPPPDPEVLRRRARLDTLVRIGFWMTAASVVLLLPMCLGCGFLMPAWAAPLVFLPAPIVFVFGGALFITAQVFANRVECEVCATWADAGAFLRPALAAPVPPVRAMGRTGINASFGGREGTRVPGDHRGGETEGRRGTVSGFLGIHIPGSRESATPQPPDTAWMMVSRSPGRTGTSSDDSRLVHSSLWKISTCLRSCDCSSKR